MGNALGSMEGYNATHRQVATKTRSALLETSQSVSLALCYTPGVLANPYGTTHQAMRGFNDGSVDNIDLDGLKCAGDRGTYSCMRIDPYVLKRVDILKGPSLLGALWSRFARRPSGTHPQEAAV